MSTKKRLGEKTNLKKSSPCSVRPVLRPTFQIGRSTGLPLQRGGAFRICFFVLPLLYADATCSTGPSIKTINLRILSILELVFSG